MSSTDVLLNVATAARLFHASDGAGFADLIIDGHRETWPLRGKRFQAWLRQQYYERTWDAPSPAALNAALNVLEAQAQFDGPLVVLLAQPGLKALAAQRPGFPVAVDDKIGKAGAIACVKELGGASNVEEDVRAAHGVRPSCARSMAT